MTTTPTSSAPPQSHDTGVVRSSSGKEAVQIGKSVVVKGALSASEDMTIDGLVEGTIELRENILTIGANGKITAKILAKSVVVFGHVHGDITAVEKIDIRDSGSVDGDLVAPRVAISEGAHFRGAIDMQRGGDKAEAKPQALAASAAPPSTGAPVR